MRSITLGAVEHDITIDSLAMELLAEAGTTTSGEFKLDGPGTYNPYFSVPDQRMEYARHTIDGRGLRHQSSSLS